MKKKIITISIILIVVICGISHSNPAIDALEDEIEQMRPTLHERPIEDLLRFNKMRRILKEMKIQEKNEKAIQEWLDGLDEPCESFIRDLDCEKIRI